MPTGVEVQGLKELRSALRKAADLEGMAAIKAAHKAAGDHIVNVGRGNASAQGKQAAKAAQSLKSTNTAGYAAVRIGGARFPFAPGSEFGSGKFKQFKPWRGSGATAGHWLWPAIRAETPKLITDYGDAIEAALSE